MMVRCSTCGNEELEGVLFCSNCGNRLFAGEPARTTSFTPDQLRDTGQLLRQNRPVEVPTGSLALRMEGDDQPVYLPDRPEVILGRADPHGQVFPDVDLGPYNAQRLGVSRQHAAVRRDAGRAFLVDLGATNGTRLNGVKLPPYEPYPINDGDEIRLGKLSIQVYFGSAD